MVAGGNKNDSFAWSLGPRAMLSLHGVPAGGAQPMNTFSRGTSVSEVHAWRAMFMFSNFIGPIGPLYNIIPNLQGACGKVVT